MREDINSVIRMIHAEHSGKRAKTGDMCTFEIELNTNAGALI